MEKEINWNELSLSYLDPYTKQCELKVQKIIYLQIANQLPDPFTNLKRVIKSYIPVVNTPIKIDILVTQSTIINEPKAHMKCGRPINSEDKSLWKGKWAKNQDCQIKDGATPKELVASKELIASEKSNVLIWKETQVPKICENKEILINWI